MLYSIEQWNQNIFSHFAVKEKKCKIKKNKNKHITPFNTFESTLMYKFREMKNKKKLGQISDNIVSVDTYASMRYDIQNKKKKYLFLRRK